MADKSKNERSGQMFTGFILLGLGLFFLLWTLDIIPGFDQTWPIFIIIVGLAFIAGAIFKPKKSKNFEPPSTSPPPPPPPPPPPSSS
jgi:hypothetical protein